MLELTVILPIWLCWVFAGALGVMAALQVVEAMLRLVKWHYRQRLERAVARAYDRAYARRDAVEPPERP